LTKTLALTTLTLLESEKHQELNGLDLFITLNFAMDHELTQTDPIHQEKGLILKMITRVALLSFFIFANQAWAEHSQMSLTPAQSYACEIQSYLIRVVIGLDGDPAVRERWKSRGKNAPLDLEAISEAMKGGEQNELDYMVLDYNIVDLLKVLYYYDSEMNLYKGTYRPLSPYPAPEFIALRLFLLKRLDRAEPVGVSALLTNPNILKDRSYQPTPEEMAASRLSMDELTFLRKLTASLPRIYDYMSCPFMLRSLINAGVLKQDALTDKKAERAAYRPLNLRLISGHPSTPVKVVFLPSYTRNFFFDQGLDLSPSGFKATEELYDISHRLATNIEREMQTEVRQESKGAVSEGKETHLLGISFYLEDERPLAIHPENARKAAAEVCPLADLVIVILGKNVRLAMHWESDYVSSPLFLDEMDIRYDQISQELDTIKTILTERLKR